MLNYEKQLGFSARDPNNMNMTALDLAREKNIPEILEVIEEQLVPTSGQNKITESDASRKDDEETHKGLCDRLTV